MFTPYFNPISGRAAAVSVVSGIGSVESQDQIVSGDNRNAARLNRASCLPRILRQRFFAQQRFFTLFLGIICFALANSVQTASTLAGCGEYVFDRLHPQIIKCPGLTLYRLPYNPQNRDKAKDTTAGQLAALMIESEELDPLLNPFPVTEISVRYTTMPTPCNGAHCRNNHEIPFGMTSLAVVEMERQGSQAVDPSHTVGVSFENRSFLFLEGKVILEGQFCDRIYRPPS